MKVTKTIRITETAHRDLKKASEFKCMTLSGFVAWCAKKYSSKAV